MDARYTSKSLKVRIQSGTSLRLSEPVAVAPSLTKPDKRFSAEGLDATPETVTVLAALLVGMLKMQLSGDCIYLAMCSAKSMCQDAGVSDEEFGRVQEIVMKKWEQMKKGNPLASMF